MPVAIDTNVALRLIQRDDPHQAAVADALLRDGAFVSLTVLLETIWVLQSYYGLRDADIASLMREFIDLNGISVPDPVQLGWVFDRFAAGADIADMIHLLEARDMGRFATFDRAIARKAGRDTPVTIETLK